MSLLLSLVVGIVLGGEARHDLHVSYGNLGLEGTTAILQIRIFKDDLEEALQRMDERESLLLEVTPEMDALFLRYLSENFVLEIDGKTLPGRILGSGYDEMDREPVWWYQIAYDLPGPFQGARVTNTILMEVFDDQSNVLRVVRFPEETRRAYYFSPGEKTVEIEF